jgi:multimeric flavodoxin WrbA
MDQSERGRVVRVAVAYTSGSGHTARVAGHVARGVESVGGSEAVLVDVSALNEGLWDTLDSADAIIFGAPTYMGGPAGAFKVFADASTSRVWFAQGWKDKLAAGFTNSTHMSGDKLSTLVYFAIFAAQHGMNWVSYGAKGGWFTTDGSADDVNRLGSFLGVMTQANYDQSPELAPPPSDLQTAADLGRRVATATRQWMLGRAALADSPELAAAG